MLGHRWLLEQPIERGDEVFGVGGATSMESPWRRKDNAGVLLSSAGPELDAATEVRHVLGDEGAPFIGCMAKQIFVGHRHECRLPGSCQHVVSTVSQPFSCARGVMGVQQQLHRARRSWRRRHAASASSAAAMLAAILSSISPW